MLIQKGNPEILVKNTSSKKLSDITMTKGFNEHFYFVQQNTMSQTDELVELNLAYEMNKFYPSKRIVYTHSTG